MVIERSINSTDREIGITPVIFGPRFFMIWEIILLILNLPVQ